ncbi:MAG TPA: hypothetical protein V6D06_17315 [Trichocoleus sp.]
MHAVQAPGYCILVGRSQRPRRRAVHFSLRENPFPTFLLPFIGEAVKPLVSLRTVVCQIYQRG